MPASLVHHKSIVVKGPNGQEPQILRADSSFRVQLITAVLPTFIMCFTTSFHFQGNPWFDGVQLLSLNPNLHHEGEVKERQRPITTLNGTEIILRARLPSFLCKGLIKIAMQLGLSSSSIYRCFSFLRLRDSRTRMMRSHCASYLWNATQQPTNDHAKQTGATIACQTGRI